MCFAFVSPLFFHRIYTHTDTHTEIGRKAAILTLQGFAGGSELHASLRLWLCVCSLIKIEKVALAAAAYAASLRRSRRHSRKAYRGLKSEIDRDRERQCVGLSTPRAASFRNDFDIKRFVLSLLWHRCH